jgi:hypothetical protein
LVRTYVLKYVDFPRLLGGMSGVLMLAWVIEEEFGVAYHPGHVRKLLHNLRPPDLVR